MCGGLLGNSATEMLASGYTVDEVSYLLTALKLSGMTCADAKAAGYVDGLKAAGYSLQEANAAGYSPAERRRAGYTCAEFKAANLTCREADAAGFSPREGGGGRGLWLLRLWRLQQQANLACGGILSSM